MPIVAPVRHPGPAPPAQWQARLPSQPAPHAMAPSWHASLPMSLPWHFRRGTTSESPGGNVFNSCPNSERGALGQARLPNYVPFWPSVFLPSRRSRGLLLALEILERLLGPLLQSLLQLLLLLLEHLRVGRRPVIRLGELGERQRQADRLAGRIDRLHGERLALLELEEHVGGHLVVGHAAVGEADDVWTGGGLVLVDDDTRAELQLHAERQGDAQQLLGLAFRLDQHGGNHGHSGLDAGVLAGEADLL